MKKKQILERALTDKRNGLMIHLHKIGYTYSDLAFMFKVAHTTVLRIVNKNK